MSLVRRAAVAVATAAALSASLAAPTATAHPARDAGPTSYAEAGPYAVGERTIKLPSGVRVEVWYPADPAAVAGKPVATYDVADWLPPALKELLPEGTAVTYPSGGVRGVPVADGKFPLVVFSHGYAGFRTQSSALTSALASWGFVVAAPDHPSRNLTRVLSFSSDPKATDVKNLRATITDIGKRSSAKGSFLHRHVAMGQIGALGHSAGGRAVETLAAVDDRVDTYIGMAPGHDPEVVSPDKPSLTLAATADDIITLDRIEAVWAAAPAPKQMVHIGGAGHLVFSDLCEVGSAQGGLLEIADALDIPVTGQLAKLATDGCLEPALEPTLAWPAIHHTVVAQFRRVFGIDSSDAALTGLVEAYPGIVSDSRSAQ